MALDFRVIRAGKVSPCRVADQWPKLPDRISRIGQRQDEPEKKNEAVHRQQLDEHFFPGQTGQGQPEQGQGQPGQGRRQGFGRRHQDGKQGGNDDLAPGVQAVHQRVALGKRFLQSAHGLGLLFAHKISHHAKDADNITQAADDLGQGRRRTLRSASISLMGASCCSMTLFRASSRACWSTAGDLGAWRLPALESATAMQQAASGAGAAVFAVLGR